jgi:hypothetical protein
MSFNGLLVKLANSGVGFHAGNGPDFGVKNDTGCCNGNSPGLSSCGGTCCCSPSAFKKENY